MKKILHEFFLEKTYNHATITKKKKNMKHLHFDFLHLMGTKFHGNFHSVISFHLKDDEKCPLFDLQFQSKNGHIS